MTTRRNFLKWIAVVGAAGATAYLGSLTVLRSLVPRTVTSSTTQTEAITTPEITLTKQTETSKLVDLKLQLFHGYHGDGLQQADEPLLKDFAVEVKGVDVDFSAKVDPDGNGVYWIRNVPSGKTYRLAPSTSEFAYSSLPPDGDFVRMQDYTFKIDTEEPSLKLGLMEGFLTSPLASKTKYSLGRFYDWDPRKGHVKWWNGRAYLYTNKTGRGWDDDHTGTDFDTNEGKAILAVAPGVVTDLVRKPSGELELDMIHGESVFKTAYFHFSRSLVEVGQRVSRGQKIAEVGETGTFYPHLHLDFYRPSVLGPRILDPYRPVFQIDSASSGYWSIDENRNKYWVSVPAESNPNLKNYWTRDNDRQFPVT